MSLKTIEKTPRELREELRKYHEEFLPKDAIFVPKMAYRPTGKNELFISFFPSELKKGVDLYVEFTSREFVPEDPNRKLYKWKFNPHYEQEYEKTSQDTDFRYLVPVQELTVINTVSKVAIEFELPDPDTDLPIDQLTIRDLTAILLKKPVSRKKWLNEIING
jgi:hypothetical protein